MHSFPQSLVSVTSLIGQAIAVEVVLVVTTPKETKKKKKEVLEA